MSKIRLLDQALLDVASKEAQNIARKRKNLNLHAAYDEPVQRFINAFEPGSYVRPHRHEPGRWEFFIILRGAVNVLVFDDEYRIASRTELRAGGPVQGVEIAGDTWHAMYTTEANSVVFEFKQGPYIPNNDKNFAAWAPPEQDARCSRFVEWYVNGAIGSTPPKI